MDIWDGLSESRGVHDKRGPDALDYAETIKQIQLTQVAVSSSASTDDLDDVCARGDTTTETITAAGFAGPLTGAVTGNADTVTTNANLTGEITSVGNAAVLDPTVISGKTDTTIVAADSLLFWDATDSTLKRVDAGELLNTLPAQSGHSGEYLTTDGSTESWASVSAGATAITSAETLYVSTTGNDTTGDGSSGTPWATIDKALTYLDDKVLLALVTIDVEAGDYGSTGNLIFDHPQGQNIYVKGDCLFASETLTGATPAAGYVDYTFTSSNPTRYHVGYYVLCYTSTNGTNPLYTQGVMKIQSVSGTTVTLRHTGFNSGTTTASGSVLMHLVVPEVKIRCNVDFNAPSKIEGIFFSWLGTLDNKIITENCQGTPILYRCVAANENAADNKSYIYIKDGCNTTIEYTGVYGTEGIQASNGAHILVNYIAGTEVKVLLESIYGSTIVGSYVSANGGNYGFNAQDESFVRIYNASLLECAVSVSSPSAGTEGNSNSFMNYSVWV